MEILDAYITSAPTPQNVIDIFKGEWSSKLPIEAGLTSSPGKSNLFEDARITWLEGQIGGFSAKKVLELGPLEGGHTYMVHQGGAGSILSVEANSRAFLKCVCVKEVLGLTRANFVLGDALEYLSNISEKFDLCIASGILYHMIKPLEFLKNAAKASEILFIWTHYYDEHIIKKLDIKRMFERPQEIEMNGKKFTIAKRNYLEALNWAGFCGGGKPWAFWLTRESLFSAIEANGFRIKAINFDHPQHPSGPAIALIAERG